MATFSELLEKMASGEKLSDLEIVELRDSAVQLEDAMDVLGNWQNFDGLIQAAALDLPFGLIYSRVLDVAEASVTVTIPSKYNHLFLMAAGRTTGAGTNSDYLVFQLNDDTGANYIDQYFTAVAAVLTGSRATGQTSGAVGNLAQGGRAAGDVGTCFAVIPHYNSPSLDKNILSIHSPPYGAVFVTAVNWNNTAPIRKIKLYSVADNIAAGAVISIFGMK